MEDFGDWPLLASPEEERVAREQREQRDRRAQVRSAQADADRRAAHGLRAAAGPSSNPAGPPTRIAPTLDAK